MPAPAPSRTLVAEGAPRGGLAALCITQTTGWDVLCYALIAAVRPISEDTGWDRPSSPGPSPPVCWSPQRPASPSAGSSTGPDRLLFVAIPPGTRLPIIAGTAACAVLLLAALPGPGIAVWLGSYNAMAHAMAAATGTATSIAVVARFSRGSHDE